ncbi:MAG: PIN domain-containing protein [Prevotella sp.]|nr:PIN domain-containing protein [Prevotella sp.]MBR6190272.1 PIN domain-containing protein [Prevotella sp.]
MDNKLSVFIDTNIFLDFIEKRPEGVTEAYAIFRLAAKKRITMLVSDLSIANMKYSTRKTITLPNFYKIIKLSRELFTIVPVGEKVVDHALEIETRDFEDALQYFSAEQAGADCIVTRNIKDFDFSSTVETLEPIDFLKKYFPEEI